MHAFCSPHAQQWFNASQSCPICKKQVQVCKKHFGPGELLGLPPNKVLESAAIALKYWMVQKEVEVTRLRESAGARESLFRQKMRQAEEYVHRIQRAYTDMKARCKELTAEQQTLRSQLTSRSHSRQDSFSPAVFEPPSNRKMRGFEEYGSAWSFTPRNFA
jgi:hypothetical protein